MNFSLIVAPSSVILVVIFSLGCGNVGQVSTSDTPQSDPNIEEKPYEEYEPHDTQIQNIKTIPIGNTATLTITEPSVEPYVDNIYTQRFEQFGFDTFENEKLHTLRTKYKLDEVIQSGATEFERQILLMEWVFHQIKLYGAPEPEYPKEVPTGALFILERLANGDRANCSQAVQILVSAAASLGWICRHVALKRPSVFSLGYYTKATAQHSVTELWSNQYGKWIMLDPMQDVYVTNLKGMPLNAYEIRQDFFATNGANLIIYEHRKKYLNDQLPRIQKALEVGAAAIAALVPPDKYREFQDTLDFPEDLKDPNKKYYKKDGYPAEEFANNCYLPNTNFMNELPQYGWSIITRCTQNICSASDDTTEWLSGASSLIIPTEDPAKDPYFAMQQVQVTAEIQDAATITLSFKTFTPNLKTYQIRIDGGEWFEYNKESYLWQLDSVETYLEVRSINKFGIAGAISKFEIATKE
ncbi:MAG: hypothetical protein JW841_06515 [Deltaproteobacteria bacterium]|nr:hypothetical protein [Deltaproteobacteria bacterium]